MQGKVTITPPDKDGNVNTFGKKKHKHKHKNGKEAKDQTEQDVQEPTSESPEPITNSEEFAGEEEFGSPVDPITSEE